MATPVVTMSTFSAALVDLDGTVWRGSRIVPGAASGIRALRAAGIPIIFVTNNTGATVAEFADRLGRAGLLDEGRPGADQVLNATAATAEYLRDRIPDATVFVIAKPVVAEELARAGVDVVEEGSADVVVAGMTETISFDLLTRTLRAFDRETTFLATNADRTTPSEEGPVPGSGAVVGAVEGMTGREPTVVGKPSTRLAAMATARLGVDAEDCLIVGDNLHTDILMGDGAGMTTAFVLTGASSREEIAVSGIAPDHVLDSLGDVDAVL